MRVAKMPYLQVVKGKYRVRMVVPPELRPTIGKALGTCTGWNVRAAGFSQGDACDLTGSYIPFAVTKAERLANGDPRLSLQERCRNSAGYTAAVTAAVNPLVSERLMLASDAPGAISNATAWFTQASGGMLQ